MTLTNAWLRYMQVLHEKAPITAAAVRPPRPLSEREDAERATAPWTPELREFFSLHDGQKRPIGEEDFVESVFPSFELLPLADIITQHRSLRDHLHDTEYLGDDWGNIARQQPAGEIAQMFLSEYIPFAEHGCGDLLCVDTRGGEREGCVREFGAEGADECDPEAASLADYVDSVRISLESGVEHSGLVPTVENGTLVWDVDFSDNPVRIPAPEPLMIHLPFALTSFQPSLIGPDDDVIDLDVVRRTVIDTAQSLHPGSVVEGGGSIFRRVPRQRGVSVSWFVEIDGQTVAFVSIVTGLGDEVIVHELPEDGLVRVLCPIVQILGSAMLNRGQYLAVCDTVASQLVCNDHSRHILQSFEQSAEELLGRQSDDHGVTMVSSENSIVTPPSANLARSAAAA